MPEPDREVRRNAGAAVLFEVLAQAVCRNGLDLRVEGTVNNTWDLRVPKALENLPALRQIMKPINERYLDVQQDVLETYLDGGQLAQLRTPTQVGLPSGSRAEAGQRAAPGGHGSVGSIRSAGGGGGISQQGSARTGSPGVGEDDGELHLSQLRYDLSQLRAKGLVQKVEGTQGYRLSDEGYRVCLFFLKVHQRLLAPLTSATQQPAGSS